MRIGLGCMRLSTELANDEARALATLDAAFDAGVALVDTARAYAPHETELGHNERLLAKAWRARSIAPTARIVTKCGMRRDGGAWIPDGRAKQIADDIAASVEALGGLPIDLLLLHVPDPRVSLATTGRALARAQEDGVVRAVGASNVSRKQLEELASHAPIAAVEVALGAYDDLAIRSGVVSDCFERGIEVLAHAPLGGPERAVKLAKDPVLAEIAGRFDDARGADVFLAYLLATNPAIVPVVGARRPETIARFPIAERLALSDEDLAKLDARFPRLGEARRGTRGAPTSEESSGGSADLVAPRESTRDIEIVVLMGIQGAGKSRAAEAYVARGYERLNRDSAGGTLRAIAKTLDARLAAGATRIVLDNTYVTRASRSDVVRIGLARGARVRCVFFDTPLAEAQINVVLRMLERFGKVVGPEEMSELARTDPAALAPHALSRMTRDLEKPASDEGFDGIDVVPFVRAPQERGTAGIAIAIDVLENAKGDGREVDIDRRIAALPAKAPCLLFGWRPGVDLSSLATLHAWGDKIRAMGRAVEIAVCSHPGGPPICWCRPPFPALLLAFAHRHDVDLRASTLIGKSPTDRRLANALGMTWIDGAE
ncbi:MAG: aldo/keto reductase [Polyangiaceae bacterium]